jgi:drug/metabolite transporter (DMT)-like permease
MSPTTRAQLTIHACVVLWGFTAILGKAISLPALPLVWWRMTLVAGLLALTPRVWRGVRAMPRRLIVAYVAIGVVVAVHWLTFYAAIKASNASVGATCMALAPVFLAVIEPIVSRRPFEPRELLLGLAVVPGVALVVGGVTAEYRLGIVFGAISAALAALFGALNKRLATHGDPLAITWLELGAGALLVTALAPLLAGDAPAFVAPGARDLLMLLALAIGCTIIPFSLSLIALRHLSAFATTLAINLEPVYAVLLAIPLFGEDRELSVSFYLGVAIILGAVVLHPRLVARTRGASEGGGEGGRREMGG